MVIGIYTGMKTERKETKAGIGKIFAIKAKNPKCYKYLGFDVIIYKAQVVISIATDLASQISSAYCLIVRSLENLPIPATL